MIKEYFFKMMKKYLQLTDKYLRRKHYVIILMVALVLSILDLLLEFKINSQVDKMKIVSVIMISFLIYSLIIKNKLFSTKKSEKIYSILIPMIFLLSMTSIIETFISELSLLSGLIGIIGVFLILVISYNHNMIRR